MLLSYYVSCVMDRRWTLLFFAEGKGYLKSPEVKLRNTEKLLVNMLSQDKSEYFSHMQCKLTIL